MRIMNCLLLMTEEFTIRSVKAAKDSQNNAKTKSKFIFYPACCTTETWQKTFLSFFCLFRLFFEFFCNFIFCQKSSTRNGLNFLPRLGNFRASKTKFLKWWFTFISSSHHRALQIKGSHQLASSVTNKKSPNVYKSCPKIITRGSGCGSVGRAVRGSSPVIGKNLSFTNEVSE